MTLPHTHRLSDRSPVTGLFPPSPHGPWTTSSRQYGMSFVSLCPTVTSVSWTQNDQVSGFQYEVTAEHGHHDGQRKLRGKGSLLRTPRSSGWVRLQPGLARGLALWCVAQHIVPVAPPCPPPPHLPAGSRPPPLPHCPLPQSLQPATHPCLLLRRTEQHWRRSPTHLQVQPSE